jgi:uncharacterized protein YbjT (DUF2867 family)
MICITGAGGTVGSEVIKQLELAKASFRAAYFSEEKAEAARAKGIDAVIIDYNRPETLRGAFQECDKLFLLGPSAPNQTQLELNAVEAAKLVGVSHIVKLSVLGADEEAFNLSPWDLKSAMLAAGSPEYYAGMLLDLERYYREGRGNRITEDIKQATGREPRRFEQYARDCASLLKPT